MMASGVGDSALAWRAVTWPRRVVTRPWPWILDVATSSPTLIVTYVKKLGVTADKTSSTGFPQVRSSTAQIQFVNSCFHMKLCQSNYSAGCVSPGKTRHPSYEKKKK